MDELDAEATRGAADPARAAAATPKHRRRWWLLGALGVVVVCVVVAVVVAERGRARPMSIGEATHGYHSVPSSGGGVHPAPGVYRYTGSGTEQLTVPPLSQPQGPTLPGTVELAANECWRFHIDYSTNHWESWVYCQRPGGLEEAGGQTWQRWMVGPIAVTNLTTSHCDAGTVALPATRTAGQRWPARCVSTSTAASGTAVSAGPYRFIGEGTLIVGGQRVRASHFLRLRTMTGAQQGTERSDVWFADATGLPIENRRTIEVRTTTILGSSTYTEVGTFVLASLTPTR